MITVLTQYIKKKLKEEIYEALHPVAQIALKIKNN